MKLGKDSTSRCCQHISHFTTVYKYFTMLYFLETRSSSDQISLGKGVSWLKGAGGRLIGLCFRTPFRIHTLVGKGGSHLSLSPFFLLGRQRYTNRSLINVIIKFLKLGYL